MVTAVGVTTHADSRLLEAPMRLTCVGLILVAGAFLAVPFTASAQGEATVIGTVTDTTGGVLPGVTVQAVHEASGNSFEAVTDQRGAYRIAVRAGTYRITAELPSFATVTRTGLELLLGQQATVNLQLAPSTLQETVTVTGEAPLVDTTSSTLAGNIDPKQMQELPVNGRNWLDLSMLAPGSRANDVGESPLPRDTGAFQLNIDGQQVTQTVATTFGQPRFSRDAIAEFEFITNRFDASQGRSSGVQVNAITKSGTNTPSGSFSGYFRDSRFIAADFVAKRVLPYSDQQLSATFGGPIRKDRIHFFGNFEYERQPQTFTYSSPFPRFNIDQTGTNRPTQGGLKFDFQMSPQTHFSLRTNKYLNRIPYDPRYTGGATIHPSSAEKVDRHSDEIFLTVLQGLGSRGLNEIKTGITGFQWYQDNYNRNPSSPTGTGEGAPLINFVGYSIGQTHTNSPGHVGQRDISFRDDFTYSFNKAGRHDLKLGGEYLNQLNWATLCNECIGHYNAQGGPIPANIEDLFPVWNDVTTWNLAAISPIVRTFTQGLGPRDSRMLRHVSAGWIQDDWKIAQRLTLNLGARYDLGVGALAEKVKLLPFLSGNRQSDTNNIAPRLGFAYSVNDKTVIRGGFGKYFGDITDNLARRTFSSTVEAHPVLSNDGRPDFGSNPFNGPTPTVAQVFAGACSTSVVPGCFRRDIQTLASSDVQIPYSYQASIGVQRQFGSVTGIEADYVFTGSRKESVGWNMNLSYDPATGVNLPFTNFNTRPYPDWGNVSMTTTSGRSNYHALQTAFTKRFSRGWQASATYLLSTLSDTVGPPYSGLHPVTFTVAPDLGGEYSLAATDQRHRAVFNGIWQLKYGFQVSGLYFASSGLRYATTYGGDARNTGGSGGRLRPDGTIVPRNNLVGKPLHRVDLRIQRTFALGGHRKVDGLLEVFNVFNHANYGSYATAESLKNYGAPAANTNVAYQPRMLQLGFRIAF